MSGTASYRVTADLQLQSNAARVLSQVARALQTLDSRITSARTNVQQMLSALSGLSARLAAVHGVVGAMNAMRGSATAATAAILRQVGALNAAATAAASAAQAMNRMTAASQAAQRAVRGAGGAGGISGYGLIGAMAGASHVGHQALRGVGAVLEAAGAGVDARAFVAARAFPEAEQRRMREAARVLAGRVPGVTTAEALTAISDMRGVVGDLEAAIRATEVVLRNARVAAIQTGRSTAEMAETMTRALSIRGVFFDDQGRPTPERGTREAEMMVAAMIAMGSRFHPREFLNFMQQAGSMGRSLSAEALYGLVPSLISETRGFRAGTALAAFNRQFLAGIMTRERFRTLQQLGLIARGALALPATESDIAEMERRGFIGDDEDREALRRRPDLVRVNPRDIVERAIAEQNPFAYYDIVIRRAMERAGARTQQDRQRLINAIASTDVVRRLLDQFDQAAEFMLDWQNFVRVWQSGRAADTVLSGSWRGALQALRAGFLDFLSGLGEAASSRLVPFLTDLGDAFRQLGATVRAYPRLSTAVLGVTALTGVLGVLSAGVAAFVLAARGIGATMIGLRRALRVVPRVGLLGAALTFLADDFERVDLSAKLRDLGRGIASFSEDVAMAAEGDQGARARLAELASQALDYPRELLISVGQGLRDTLAGWASGLEAEYPRTAAALQRLIEGLDWFGQKIEEWDARANEGLREIIGAVEWFIGKAEDIAARVQRFLERIGATIEAGRAEREMRDAEGLALGEAQRRFRENRDRMLRQLYPDAPVPLPQNFNPVPPGGRAGAPIPIILQLDGREVGRGVLPHIGREAAGPVQGRDTFDGRRALASPADVWLTI